MSNMSVKQTMKRIEIATPASQICVLDAFKNGLVNPVFAQTVMTQKMIDEKHPDIIGVYDKTMNLKEIEDLLTKYSRRY